MMSLWAAAVVLALAPARADDAWRDALCVEAFQPFYRPRTQPEGTLLWTTARRAAKAAAFERPKREGAYRVFLIGASTAHMFDEEWLAEALRAALPGRPIEVIDAGVPGYDSPRVSRVLSEVLDYEPDAVVEFSAGLDSAEDRLSCEGGRPREEESPLRRRERRAAAFEAGLRERAAASRARGFLYVLTAQPANLRDMPPWGAAAGEAAEAFARGRYALAAELDPAADRFTPAKLEIVRRVARAYGLHVADLQGELRRGGVDRPVFLDAVHVSGRYDAMFARAIVAALLPGAKAPLAAPLSLSRERAAAESRVAFDAVVGSLREWRDSGAARGGGLNERSVAGIAQWERLSGQKALTADVPADVKDAFLAHAREAARR